jgi:hypothetical protein
VGIVKDSNVEVVVSPPTIMLLKTLAIPPRGLSLEPVSAGDGLVVPEVVASFPPLVLL